mgnify:CR=1 FL=1
MTLTRFLLECGVRVGWCSVERRFWVDWSSVRGRCVREGHHPVLERRGYAGPVRGEGRPVHGEGQGAGGRVVEVQGTRLRAMESGDTRVTTWRAIEGLETPLGPWNTIEGLETLWRVMEYH